MNGRKKTSLTLNFNLKSSFLPVVAAATEQAALAFNLGKNDALRLTLAVEEIFNYLLEIGNDDENILINYLDGYYHVEVNIALPVKKINLRAFNLTYSVSPEDDSKLNEMGLLLASRMADRMYLSLEKNQYLRLQIYKEKSYPEIVGDKPVPAGKISSIFVTPCNEDLKDFCQGITATQQSYLYPLFFRFPGKFADMVNSGDYHALIAYNSKNRVIGGISWHESYEKTLECFGPYVFADDRETSEKLLERCLEQVGRTPAPGILNRCAIPGSGIEKYFEYLGATTFHSESGDKIKRNAHYRQLCEDMGSRVWAHPDLLSILKEDYSRLFLPREVREVKNMGEYNDAYSVFACDFGQKEVIIRPLMAGHDAASVLAQHIQLFARENLKNIFFELDLGEEWNAQLTPAVLSNGFRPCFTLPYAGKGDLLLLQYNAGEEICQQTV